MSTEMKWALLASPTDEAQTAARALREQRDWVDLAEAELVIALGGDGFMLQVQHAMLEEARIVPVFGMNLGTVGFLMNEWRTNGLEDRIARAKRFSVSLAHGSGDDRRPADQIARHQRGFPAARNAANRKT